LDRIIEILTKKYGRMRPLSGGFTHAAYRLEGPPPLVAKVASRSKHDIDNEVKAITFLQEATYTPKSVDSLSADGFSAIVTTFIEGVNGQAILDTGDIERSEALFRRMGVRLAKDIHVRRYDGEARGLRIARPEAYPFYAPFLPEWAVEASRSFLACIDTAQKDWVFTHGDFGAHNVLDHNDGGLAVIDWEWAEWFHPLADVAWTCWNTKLHYPQIADRLNRAFLAAYQSVRPINATSDLIKTYSLYKIWTVLDKIRDADADVQEKWVQRLIWTLTEANF